MRFRASTIGVFALVCGLQLYAQPADSGANTAKTPPPTIITFDVPGAAAFIGTFGISINPAGEITGTYSDANFTARFFKRAVDGTLTSARPISIRRGKSRQTSPTQTSQVTASCVPATEVSPRSMLRALAARASSMEPSLLASTQQGTSREISRTQAVEITAFCGPVTALSPRSMPRAALAAPSPSASIRAV
jgi:hypothetical protein